MCLDENAIEEKGNIPPNLETTKVAETPCSLPQRFRVYGETALTQEHQRPHITQSQDEIEHKTPNSTNHGRSRNLINNMPLPILPVCRRRLRSLDP